VQRRTFIKASAATALIAREWRALARGQPNAQPANDCCTAFVWQTMVPTPANVPALNGHTDTIPDIVGRLGSRIDLAIFTEGNHFPALLGGASSIVEVRAYLVLVMWKTESWSKFSGTTSHPEAEAERRIGYGTPELREVNSQPIHGK